MSSSNVSDRPKITVSLEEWEIQAQLDDVQVKSINLLKDLCQERQLPLKFSNSAEYTSRSSSPVKITVSRHALSPLSRPETPMKPDDGSKPSYGYLHPKQPIETPEQFHDWFAAVERSIVHSQDAHFHAHLENVTQYRLMCETLLQTINDLESDLDSIFVEWRRVEENGHSLKDACERLLQERDHLLNTTEAISLRLEYFQELEHATRMLNYPGESLVLQTDFLLMVERIDLCLEYLQSHQDFKEAKVYSLRFHQCLMRAMTLIRMFFIASLKALTADIQRRISDKDMSDTAHLHLLYSKFNTASTQVASLLAELEKRAKKYPDELGSLLAECHTAYLNSRKSLLFSRVAGDIKGLDPHNSDLVELTKNGCTYMRQLCIDEATLYSRFFHTGEEQLSRYLEILSDFLFDDLRPRILHEARLTILCEVCTVLQALIDLDVEPADNLYNVNRLSEDDEVIDSQEAVVRPYIRPILQLVLQDAQTRLVFKAQTLMESEIRFYKPSAEDIAYPFKLQPENKHPAAMKDLVEKEEGNLMKLLPSSIYHRRTWYPTVTKTLWILAQLHEFINPVVFNDIAQEAIEFCRQSLKFAADQLIANPGVDSITHGQLFLIRHLLILKDIIGQLNLTYRNTEARPELDTFGAVLRNTSALLQSTRILSLVGAGDGQSIDARAEIDNDLANTCDKLISRHVEIATVPLRIFLEQWSTSKDHGFIQSSTVSQVHESFRGACEPIVRTFLGLLHRYLEDEKMIGLLAAPVKTKITEIYSRFWELIEKASPQDIKDKLLSPADFANALSKIEGDVRQQL